MNNGEPVYSTVFNIVVDSVVRAVLMEVCRPQEGKHGLRWAVGDNSIVFYADNSRIAGRKPIWVHKTLTSVVRLFERVRL